MNSEDSHQSATEDAREAGSALAEALISDAKDADQEQIVRGISMVANIELIADSLDQNSPSLREVVTPDEPASARVLKVPIQNQINPVKRVLFKRIRKIFKK